MNEISWEIHRFLFKSSTNATLDFKLDGILQELIKVRKHDKSTGVSNLIKLVLNISSPNENANWLTKEMKLLQLSSRINNRVWTSWVDSLPLPLPPGSEFEDVTPPKTMIRQMKLPDCSLIAVINAVLFGKNNMQFRITLKTSAAEIYLVFYLNGSPKIIITPYSLTEKYMCNTNYGMLIEKAYFSMLGYYSDSGDLDTESENIRFDFKGADFTDVGMELLGFIPLPVPMVLDVDEWKPIYVSWLQGDSIIGFGTSNFNDIKRIKLANGDPYIIIPNHDYPLINIINHEHGYLFDVFDGLKVVQFQMSDLIHFNILSINKKPPSVHQTESFIISGKSWLEFSLKSTGPFYIVLERHLPKSRGSGAPSTTENLMLYKTSEKHQGPLWERDTLLKQVWNISRFSVIECTTPVSQLCLDLKSTENNLTYTLHLYSETTVGVTRVFFDDYLVKEGRFNNKSKFNTSENPCWEFSIPREESEYVQLYFGVFLDSDDEVDINVLDGDQPMYDQTFQKGKQIKSVFLQTNKEYKLILTTSEPSFSKYRLVSSSAKWLLFTE